MVRMVIDNFLHTDPVQAILPSLAGREISIRALDFVAVAARASEDDARQGLLGLALETASVLVGIDADDETIAAALIVASIPRNAIDAGIIGDAFGPEVWLLVSGVHAQ